jgi:hypothetical protein
MSTPRDTDIAGSVELLNRMWAEAGREGRPEIVVLGPRPDEETVTAYEKIGVTEMMVGVLEYIARRGERLQKFG